MKKSVVISAFAVIISVLAVGGGLALVKKRQLAAASQQQQGFEPSESVTSVVVSTAPWSPTAKLVGAIFAIESIELRNEMAGVLKEIKFESGAVVEKDSVLAVLDSSTEEADLATARANVRVMQAGREVANADVDSMQAAIGLARSEVRRLTQAVESKAAAENVLERAQSEVAQSLAKLQSSKASVDRAEAELEQARARVVQLEVLLAKKTLKAPFRARAGIRTIHPGQYLPEGTKIVDLQSINDNVYLDFAIPQDEAWRVKPGMVVLAKSASLGSQFAKLTVQAVDSSVDRSTRNVRVRSIVANPDEKLRPGTFVDIEVPMDLPREKVMVPSSAVRRASYGDHVFVVVDGEDVGTKRVKQRIVQLGVPIIRPDGNYVIIENGVAAGEVLAGHGSFKLKDGSLVTIQPPEVAPAAPAASPEAEKAKPGATPPVTPPVTPPGT